MEWINLNDEWPEIGEIVLCCDAISGCVSLGKQQEDSFDFLSVEPLEGDIVATHWMKLPSVPEMTFEEN